MWQFYKTFTKMVQIALDNCSRYPKQNITKITTLQIEGYLVHIANDNAPNINEWIEQAAESGINYKILSDFEIIGPHSILFAYAEWNCLERLLV